MKYITFAVPCYNSENYMRRCVDSLLIGGKDVEIILIDDGSSDRTAQIADEYEIEYPDIVRVVHKENGGHGSGVNKGLELANGIYYKVVDSDDWFDKESYQKLLVKLKAFTGERPDIAIIIQFSDFRFYFSGNSFIKKIITHVLPMLPSCLKRQASVHGTSIFRLLRQRIFMNIRGNRKFLKVV